MVDWKVAENAMQLGDKAVNYSVQIPKQQVDFLSTHGHKKSASETD
jgi:hypothetical protein